MRGSNDEDGRFELPILHTAGGLVGGDKLTLRIIAEQGTRSLLTTVAAQKVYGSVGLSRVYPKGRWANQVSDFQIEEYADLEWLPQELVLFSEGLFEQTTCVELYPESSFISAEVVRLGRTASGENLGSGCWRSQLGIRRNFYDRKEWEFVDRLELTGDAIFSDHGIGSQPVFGSMIWIAPISVSKGILDKLVESCLLERNQLDGSMYCNSLEHGITARYVGSSSQAARYWFCRIWALTRSVRKLSKPKSLRVWPMQENPFSETLCNMS